VIGSSTGSRFGEGLYLSPSLGKAHQYVYADSKQAYQIFFSLVLLGHAHMLPVDPKQLSRVLAQPRDPDEDSRVSPDGLEYIVPYGECVLPFFLVTYCNRGRQAQSLPMPLPGDAALHKTGVAADKRRANDARAAAKSEAAVEAAPPPQLVMTRVPCKANEWVLVLDPAVLREALPHTLHNAVPVHTRLVVILDKSRSMGSSFAKVSGWVFFFDTYMT
jgi:hypothetical protein